MNTVAWTPMLIFHPSNPSNHSQFIHTYIHRAYTLVAGKRRPSKNSTSSNFHHPIPKSHTNPSTQYLTVIRTSHN